MKKRKFDSAVLSIPKCRKEITLDDLIYKCDTIYS